MDKLIAILGLVKSALLKRKGDNDWVSFILGELFMFWYIVGDYAWWYLTAAFKRWDIVETKMSNLSDIKDQPTAILTTIKTLQVRYNSETPVTVTVHPSLVPRYETWTFRIRGERLRVSTIPLSER